MSEHPSLHQRVLCPEALLIAWSAARDLHRLPVRQAAGPFVWTRILFSLGFRWLLTTCKALCNAILLKIDLHALKITSKNGEQFLQLSMCEKQWPSQGTCTSSVQRLRESASHHSKSQADHGWKKDLHDFICVCLSFVKCLACKPKYTVFIHGMDHVWKEYNIYIYIKGSLNIPGIESA